MTVPVGFIAITVLISIDLLTVFKLWLMNADFFFSSPLPEGEAKEDLRRG